MPNSKNPRIENISVAVLMLPAFAFEGQQQDANVTGEPLGSADPDTELM